MGERHNENLWERYIVRIKGTFYKKDRFKRGYTKDKQPGMIRGLSTRMDSIYQEGKVNKKPSYCTGN